MRQSVSRCDAACNQRGKIHLLVTSLFPSPPPWVQLVVYWVAVGEDDVMGLP